MKKLAGIVLLTSALSAQDSQQNIRISQPEVQPRFEFVSPSGDKASWTEILHKDGKYEATFIGSSSSWRCRPVSYISVGEVQNLTIVCSKDVLLEKDKGEQP